MQSDFFGKTRADLAIDRLRQFEPPEGYYLAFSGGKDSIVIHDLAVKSGVKFSAHYSQGGIDPPELVHFIMRYYPYVERHRPETSIWNMVQSHGMPTRVRRWCCAIIKESLGSGIVVTGVRWAESAKRRRRNMVESCNNRPGKRYLNPIIDFTDADVWEYIRENHLPYCGLYDEGFKRLGCIMCPMTTRQQTKIEAARWPELAMAWEHAARRFYDANNGDLERYPTFDSFYSGWWLQRLRGREMVADCQMGMFD